MTMIVRATGADKRGIQWLPPFARFAPIANDLVAKVGMRERWFGCVGSAAIAPGRALKVSRIPLAQSGIRTRVAREFGCRSYHRTTMTVRAKGADKRAPTLAGPGPGGVPRRHDGCPGRRPGRRRPGPPA